MARCGRFLVVAWDGGGNVPPAVAIARRLLRRGHAVRVLGTASLRGRFEAAGCDFREYVSVPSFDPARSFEDQMELFLELLCGEGLAADVLDELDGHRTDVAVVDCMLGGALCAMEHARVPAAVFVHFLYQPWAEIWGGGMLPLEETRTRLGLPQLASRAPADLLEHARATLVLTPRELDFPVELPPNASYVGPVFDDEPDTWEHTPPDERPLVVVTLSTTYQHQEAVLANVLAALADLPVRVLVTLGFGLRVEDVEAPPNTVVVRWAPHRTVLGTASLAVTHAGHGTIVAALAEGVPLLCIPLGREQPFNAERVRAIGAGEALSAESAPQEIGAVAERLLTDAAYREAAAAMAATIAGYRDGAGAIEALEGLLAQQLSSSS